MGKKELQLISVIVPVYNAEKYLVQCIDSIINQTYLNLEIILVDDGSGDNSPQICDKYAKMYDNVQVIHQNNKGAVNARKKGVSVASGEYITFVDSDDWIERDMYEKLVEGSDLNTVDIIACGFTRLRGNRKYSVANSFEEGIYEGTSLEKLYTSMMYDDVNAIVGVNPSLCTKLIRKTILEKCIYNVNDRITYGDDAAVVYNCFLYARCISIKNIAPYFYRVNTESMCHTKNIEAFANIYEFYSYMQKICEGYEEYSLLHQLNMYTVDMLQMALKNNFNLKQRKAIMLPKLYTVRVVLYGAGIRGQAYYKEIKQDANIDLVAWVDKHIGGQIVNDYKIDTVDTLLDKQFDKLIISVKEKKLADEIKKELSEQGIDLSKVVWKECKFKKDVYWLEWGN